MTRLLFFVEAMWNDMVSRLVDPLQAAFDQRDTPKVNATPAHCVWDAEEEDT